MRIFLMSRVSWVAVAALGLFSTSVFGQTYESGIDFHIKGDGKRTFVFSSPSEGNTALPQKWPDFYTENGQGLPGDFSAWGAGAKYGMAGPWDNKHRPNVAASSVVRMWGWSHLPLEHYSMVKTSVSRLYYGGTGGGHFNNLARGNTVDMMDHFPKPPLLEMEVPAGASWVEFSGDVSPVIPFTSLFAYRSNGAAVFNFDRLRHSWFFFYGVDGDWYDGDGDELRYWPPAVEVLRADGVTRLGVTPLVSVIARRDYLVPPVSWAPTIVNAFPTGNTLNTRIAMPAGWPGGKVKVRLYPAILQGTVYGWEQFPSHANNTAFNYVSMLAASGNVNVYTDINPLSGTVLTSETVLEGYVGEVPVEFAVE